jgi:hypothetical protein
VKALAGKVAMRRELTSGDSSGTGNDMSELMESLGGKISCGDELQVSMVADAVGKSVGLLSALASESTEARLLLDEFCKWSLSFRFDTGSDASPATPATMFPISPNGFEEYSNFDGRSEFSQ